MGWVRGVRALITGASEPTQAPKWETERKQSRMDSEKASGHQSFKADLGQSGEKEAGGCGKIVPSLPRPVTPWWPSLAYWVAAGSQAPVASLLALQILASPLHPEPLRGLAIQRRALQKQLSVTHQEESLHPAEVLTF